MYMMSGGGRVTGHHIRGWCLIWYVSGRVIIPIWWDSSVCRYWWKWGGTTQYYYEYIGKNYPNVSHTGSKGRIGSRIGRILWVLNYRKIQTRLCGSIVILIFGHIPRELNIHLDLWKFYYYCCYFNPIIFYRINESTCF